MLQACPATKEVLVCVVNMLSCDVDKNLKFYYSRYIYPFNQVIDPLHISNHKNPKCHDLYNPKKATDSIPDCNLMIAEQTFSWLSRYKKILNSMPKNHHLFFLHRTVYRRNQYTELCQRLKRKPLLPKSKKDKSPSCH